MMKKICKNCGGIFTTSYPQQVYCSRECRAGWQYREQQRKKQDEEEAEKMIMEIWHDKEEQGLKISVCKNCLRFQWLKEPQDFCSRGCEVIYNGH